jgi:hypothetical protein
MEPRDIYRSDGHFNVAPKTQLIIFFYPAFVNSLQPAEPRNVKADSKPVEFEYFVRKLNSKSQLLVCLTETWHGP